MSIREVPYLLVARDKAERRIQTNSRLYFLIAFLAPLGMVFETTAKYDQGRPYPRSLPRCSGGLWPALPRYGPTGTAATPGIRTPSKLWRRRSHDLNLLC